MDETEIFKRYFKIKDVEKRGERSIIASLSTEYPLRRGNGLTEILVHESNAIDLSRAPLPFQAQRLAENLKAMLI